MSGPPGFCSFPRVLRTYWDLKEEDVVSIYEKGRLGENISHDAVGGPHPAEREKWLHMFLGRKFWQGQGALELMGQRSQSECTSLLRLLKQSTTNRAA